MVLGPILEWCIILPILILVDRAMLKIEFHEEADRLYKVLDSRLENRKYICDEYSIVDMACWPWVSRYEWQKINLSKYPCVRRWYRQLLQREAVQAGYHVPKHMGKIPEG